jgi:hypothetical protein
MGCKANETKGIRFNLLDPLNLKRIYSVAMGAYAFSTIPSPRDVYFSRESRAHTFPHNA